MPPRRHECFLLFSSVGLKPQDQLAWMAECGRVTAVDFVGDNLETFSHDATEPRRRKEAVVAT